MSSNGLNPALIDFLNSASTADETLVCSDCGSALEYRNSTFFYEGQSWQVSLPICLKCHPIVRVPAHDA